MTQQLHAVVGDGVELVDEHRPMAIDAGELRREHAAAQLELGV